MRFLILSIFYSIIFSLSIVVGQTDVEGLVEKANLTYDANPEESFSFYEKAENLAIKNNDHEFDGEIHVGKGRYYLLTTEYVLATQELTAAIDIFKKSNDKKGLAHAYSLKSILHNRIGEPDESHFLLLKVLNLNKELKDTSAVLGNLFNLSLDYIRALDIDSTKILLDEASSYENFFDRRDYYFYNQNLGSYYLISNQIDLSVEHYWKAHDIAVELEMTDSRATILMMISKAYRLKGDFKNAELYAYNSYTFSKDNSLLYETSEGLQELILVKEAQGQFENAYKLQKDWLVVEQEIFSLEKAQKVKSMEAKIDLVEKEKIITEGEVALQTEKLKGEQTKTKMIWLLGAVAIVLILMSFTVYINLKTKKLNKTIKEQKKEVEIKSNSLEYALKNINDSIEYSKRIQNAILPPIKLVKQHLEKSFILYKPKDIVAGDFYWMEQKDNKILFAAADCTGHGVPGAMVSVVCNNALNRAVREHGLIDPGQILNKSREIVIQEFEKSDEDVKDGMDIALCCLEGNILKYAGAHNPLWIIRERELIETKGDKQPIGKFFNEKPFVTHTVELQKNDSLYIFSDGYADQFGGENGKKFKLKTFKELLLNIQHLDMDSQKTYIDETFETWKGDLEQLDDVCVIGVKI
jgi:serine phosphatase RsbU (regulator of sigma subunit)